MNSIFKKSFAILLAILMLVTAVPFAVFAAETCEDGKHNYDSSKWVDVDGKGPTCTEKGQQTNSCTICSTSATRDVDALGHDTEGVETTTEPATCLKEGSEYKICKRCKEKVEVKTLPKSTEHTKYRDTAKEYIKEPANCVDAAVYYFKCSVCGLKLEETYSDGGPDESNHKNPVSKKDGKPATCTEPGTSDTIDCGACEKNISQPGAVVPAKGHTYGNVTYTWSDDKKTCTATASCTECDESTKGHTVTETVEVTSKVTTPATCAAKGVTTYTATFKNEAFKEQTKEVANIDALTHEFNVKDTSEKYLKSAATCTKAAVYFYKCKNCAEKGEETYESGKALGHDLPEKWTYPENFDCTKGGLIYRKCQRKDCDVENFIEDKSVPAGEHTPKEITKEIPATCMNPGKKAKIECSVCGIVIQKDDEIPKLDNHDFSGDAIPNKENPGTHLFKCKNGCDQYGAGTNYICAEGEKLDCKCDVCGYELEHKWGEFVSDNNATCGADGTKTQTCTICGKKNTVADENSKANGNHVFTKYVYDEGTATCTEDGTETAKCDLCGVTETKKKDGSALGHDADEWTYPTDFDCKVGGDRYKLCKRCSAIAETETVVPKEHTAVGDAEVAATCTTPGKTAGSHCSVCGLTIITPVEIPAKGHDYAETVIAQATCTQAGLVSYTCRVCSDTYATETAKLDHSGEWTNVKAATCLEAGMKTRICTVCGTNETAEIEKLPHTVVVDKGYAATCTDTGVADGSHCGVCGTILKDRVEIPATGHTKKVVTTSATTSSSGKSITSCTVCGKTLSKVNIAKIKSIKLSQNIYEYNGKTITPTVVVKDSQGKTLKKGTDYTVKYSSGRKHIGRYKVVITFKGNYSGKKTLKFRITPKIVSTLKVTAAKKSVTLNWSKAKYANKYVIYYSTNKDGGYKKLGSTAKLTFTATELKSGKTYYFKVKSVKKTDSGNFYANASPIKKATVK